MSVETRFKEKYAEYKLSKRLAPQDNDQFVSGSLRWKLYGLGKQANEGDCKVACPSKENALLRAKWDCWVSFRGISETDAMAAFLQCDMNDNGDNSELTKSSPSLRRQSLSNVDQNSKRRSFKMDVDEQRTTRNVKDIPGTISSKGELFPDGIIRQGILFKQRDVFKGWRPRKFVLKDSFLHYYVADDDPFPRKSMDISGCNVVPIKATMIGDTEFYPFVISHPNSKDTYTLASDSRDDAEIWINAIREATKNNTSTIESTPGVVMAGQYGESNIIELLESPSLESKLCDPVRPDLTFKDIPNIFKKKINNAIDQVVRELSSTAQWEQMYDCNDVIGRKKMVNNLMCVRGDAELNFPLLKVFELLWDHRKHEEFNSQLSAIKLLHIVHEPTTKVAHLLFKRVWPTAARDFVTLSNWRQLEDGRVVIIHFSDSSFDKMFPPADGHVRADLVLSGYILAASKDGTKTSLQQYILTDLKGSLPASVVNMVARDQPLCTAVVRKLLEANQAKNGPPPVSDGSFTIEDLLRVAGQCHDQHVVTANPLKEHLESPQLGEPLPVAAQPPQPVSHTTKAPAVATKVKDVVPLSSLLMMFLPPLLYYVVENRQFRGLSFVVGVCIMLKYVVHSHLGPPRFRRASPGLTAATPSGKILVSFPVDLGKLLRYLDAKRDESGVDVTMTHIVLKAVAVCLTPENFGSLKGYVIDNTFFPCLRAGVDISASVDIAEAETVMLKIADADKKPVEYMAQELQKMTKEIKIARKTGTMSRKDQLLSWFSSSPFLTHEVDKLLTSLSSSFGCTLPLLGISAFPLGVCCVMTSPNREGDADMAVALVPHAQQSTAPITVTLGGIRVLPSMDTERKVLGAPVLNVSVCIDSSACTVADGRRFCSKLQQLMHSPNLLDTPDKNSTREDDSAARRASVTAQKKNK